MPTPHIEAKEGQIAEIVLMPGDPLRAKMIAEKYLTKVELVNEVRGMFCYTGYYKNKRISVMGSGMGMPSMGIYSYELYKFYDVKTIIRIGSCGCVSKYLNIGDIILVEKAITNSTFALQMNGQNSNEELPNLDLNEKIKDTAIKNNIKIYEKVNMTTDVFNLYTNNSINDKEYNYDVCEMEAFALFHNARNLGKEASCLVTVSDSIYKHEQLSAEEREQSFTKMIELALESTL
jgi:purine-nucleoside phosphorylase